MGVAGSFVASQRRVARGLLKRWERWQILFRAPNDEVRAVAKAADVDPQEAVEAVGQAGDLAHRPGAGQRLSLPFIPSIAGCCHGNWLVSAAGGE